MTFVIPFFVLWHQYDFDICGSEVFTITKWIAIEFIKDIHAALRTNCS